jgi:death-on-curing protein
MHEILGARTGGSVGVRDWGLLESALQSVFATFDGVDLFATIEEKAARLGYGLISNHAFVDGNKRIGMFVMLVFLEINGVQLNCTDEDVFNVACGIAAGEIGYGELREWVNKFRMTT